MVISLIHPSRSRPEQAIKTMHNWLNKAGGQFDIEYIFSLDYSDPLNQVYNNLLREAQRTDRRIGGILYADNKSVVDAANYGARLSRGQILVLVSDDFDCPEFWDIAIYEAMRTHEGCVLKTFDGVQKYIVTLPIMDRKYYEMQGYMYYPHYRHMFADTDMTHKADVEGRLLIRNDITFTHNHYSTGNSKKDDVNTRADATWAQGEAVYLQRVRDRFGLPESVNVMHINALAGAPHLNWLNNKLGK